MASGQPFEIVSRQYARAKALIAKTAATPAGEYLALKAVSADMQQAIAAYEQTDAAVGALERSAAKELKEAIAAMKPLTTLYDQTREVVMLKIPGTEFGAASKLATPQDLINEAEKLEDALEERAAAENNLPDAERWAGPLFTAFVPVLDAAVKEQNEAAGALLDLQKAQAARASEAGASRPTFVRFRRIVRSTFGRQSREYRSLLDRRDAPVDDEEPVTPPT